jgi:hypothetical protein
VGGKNNLTQLASEHRILVKRKNEFVEKETFPFGNEICLHKFVCLSLVFLSNKGYLVVQKGCPVPYLLIIIEFDAVCSELPSVSLNKLIKFTHTYTHIYYIYIYIVFTPST